MQLADDVAAAAQRIQGQVHAVRVLVEVSKALRIHVVPGSGALLAEEEAAFTQR